MIELALLIMAILFLIALGYAYRGNDRAREEAKLRRQYRKNKNDHSPKSEN